MDLAQLLISYAEWIFFIAWGALLAAVSVITFARDILPVAQRAPADHALLDRAPLDRALLDKERRWADGD
jgi:hypothetical protein